MELMKFTINAKSENQTRTIVTTRGFKMTIDEPEMLGGEDQGANPVEYLLGALSGCLNVVGHIVAKEMGFDFNGMEISIEGGLNPDKFLGKSSEERTGFQYVNVTIKPDTDADEGLLKKWLRVVEDRCPVSDNINNATPLSLELASREK